MNNKYNAPQQSEIQKMRKGEIFIIKNQNNMFDSFLSQKQTVYLKMAEDIWGILGKTEDYDAVSRIIAGLYQKNYHRLLKTVEEKHTEGGTIPKFMRKNYGEIGEQDYNLFIDYPLGDHHGRITKKCKISYGVLEPYHIDLAQLKELVNWCEEKKLDLSIDGSSQHFVGRTVRVLIWKKNGT